MKRLTKVVAVLAAVIAPSFASAQDKPEATLQADIVSSYLWRGTNPASGSVQPTLGVSWKGLSLNAWGSYGFVNTDDAKELDLTLSYSIVGLNIGITDYYIATGSGDCPGKYFRYKSGENGAQKHVFEANLGYDFGFLALNWYTNFAGADKDHSSYFEVKVPFKLGVNWELNAGIVPYKSVYYNNKNFTCTNVTLKASKDIAITDRFSLPVFGQLTANPDNGKFYLAFGVSLGI